MALRVARVAASAIAVFVAALGSATMAAAAGTAAIGGWSSRTVPINVPGPVEGSFQAISCVSSTACVAVGQATLPSGDEAPFVANLVDGTWKQDVLRLPAEAVSATLDGVSCAAATKCMAVGEYTTSASHALVERLSGAHWTATTDIDPPGNPTAELSAVSCNSPSRCTAAGTSDGIGYVDELGSSQWAAVPLPVPAGASSSHLSGIACIAAGPCVAVGTATVGTGTEALMYVGGHANWAATVNGAPNGSLSAVSCIAAENCVAVGDMADTLSGTTWIPDSSWPVTETLTAVSCVPGSEDTCMAFGPGPHILKSAAGTWSTDRPSTLPNDSALVGTCSAATTCDALSWSAQLQTGLALDDGVTFVSESAGVWVSTYLPGPQASTLERVSCSLTACVSVGAYYAATGQTTFFDWLAGGTWHESLNPLPLTYFGSPAVSCKRTICVAVEGSSAAVSSNGGATWTVNNLPRPPTLTGTLIVSDVSCASAGHCVAVGRPDAAGDALFAETLSDGIWTPQTLPLAAGTVGGNLNAVSCTAPTACVAVGSAETSTKSVPLIETLSGTKWTALALTPPTQSGWFQSVSCFPTTSSCAAGGWWQDSGTGPLLARLSTRKWTLDAQPERSTTVGQSNGYRSVACSSSNDCYAIGFALRTSSTVFSESERWVERWTGAQWVQTPGAIPVPNGAALALPTSVVCASARWCTITGAAAEPWSKSVDEVAFNPVVSVMGAPRPSFSSSASAVAMPGVPFTFVVQTSSSLGDALTESGSLPAGFSFTGHDNGTATISGTATSTETGTYKLRLSADNGLAPAKTQAFTLTVGTIAPS